jgi:predicted MFS family arabinose efflux permease
VDGILTRVRKKSRAPLGVDRWLVVLLAVASGATVANLYYAQPLLPQIAGAFHISDGTAGLLVTVVQVSYAIGLLLIVPLGDLVHRRRLIARLLTICTVGLVLAAAAPSFSVLAAALAVTALTSVVVQILVPFASTLAPAEHRGAVVGKVFSGLLTGILLARTVSGLIAGFTDWRVPFIVAAGLMVIIALALWRALPDREPPSSLPYPRLLLSVGRLIRDEPALRRRMFYGACGFAGFSLVWTTIAFLLARAPYGYGDQAIGLFGLAGLVGALGAQGFGRLADRGSGRRATGVVLLCVLASWGLLALAGSSVVAVVLGLIVIDFGVQGQNVLSTHVIYGFGHEQASRVTTAYTTSNFVGGAIGSAVGSAAWSAGGWGLVCVCGAVMAALPVGLWLTEFLPRRVPSGGLAEECG